MTYARTNQQKQHDYHNSKVWEEQVGETVGNRRWTITKFTSTNDLDIWVPGYYLELKEKNQPYSTRWTDLTDVPEEFLFISDELTVRRALKHYPYVMFLIRDNTQQRLYIAPIWVLVSVPRVRIDRNGKGKWLIDLRQFDVLDSEEFAVEYAERELANTGWLQSPCVGLPPGEVKL